MFVICKITPCDTLQEAVIVCVNGVGFRNLHFFLRNSPLARPRLGNQRPDSTGAVVAPEVNPELDKIRSPNQKYVFINYL